MSPCAKWMLPSEPFKIASVAMTLADVKALPAAQQDLALLRRLVHLYPQMRPTGGLHKGNLLLDGDPYGLGMGLSETERMPILRHLLGAPWTRLVNAGFLSDPEGTNFFFPTDEGIAAIAAADRTMASNEPKGERSLASAPKRVKQRHAWLPDEWKFEGSLGEGGQGFTYLVRRRGDDDQSQIFVLKRLKIPSAPTVLDRRSKLSRSCPTRAF